MKKLLGIVTVLCAVFLIGHAAFAGCCEKKAQCNCDKKCKKEKKIQAYAHPTMFKSADLNILATDATYVIGGKLTKKEGQVTIKGKDYVAIDSWAKDILATIKANTKDFDAKAPVLRSELATILVEGLSIDDGKNPYKYTDLTSGHWAKDYIDRALGAKIMIGYPDRTFKPDQRVTKAEVFATIATLIDVPIDKSMNIPPFKGYKMEYIPKWATAATKEVMASELLDAVPDSQKVAESEYLSKEQVAYLVSTLRQSQLYNAKYGTAGAKYVPTCIPVKIDERVSAKVANVGDVFRTKTTKAVTVAGCNFPAGSTVKGKVVQVARPGYKTPGYLKVKFTEIKSGKQRIVFPKEISEVQATKFRDPNFVARLFGAPVTIVGRVAGVSGRTVSTTGEVISDGAEQLVDNISNTIVNTFDLHPVAGARSFGTGFVTIGTGVYNIFKLAGSGLFGLVYEITDEIKYLIIPSTSNDSSLNPGEEMIIVF